MPLNPHIGLDDDELYMLSPLEKEWVEVQPYLLQRGYRLRPRFHPNWKPSWKKKRLWGSKSPRECPDSISFYKAHLIDAVRISDNKKVVLKKVNPQQEVAVLQHLHSPELEKDPRNNTVPLLDVIAHPTREDVAFIVMPMLYAFENVSVPFEYVSEVLEALDQFLKGLEFLHEQQIAHRDACVLNLMMDAAKVLPGGFHFARPLRKPDGKGSVKPRSRRAVGPIKYYIIDYELAFYYPGNEDDSYGTFGQDKTVPEFADEYALYDPFKLDVYQMGGVIQILAQRYGLTFLEGLEAQMRCRDPGKRLTAAETYKKFSDIVNQLPLQEISRKITRKSKKVGEPILLGPEKYEKQAEAESSIDSAQQKNSSDSADPDNRCDSPTAHVYPPDTSTAQVAEVLAYAPDPESSTVASTDPGVESQATAGDIDESDRDQSALDMSCSFHASDSAISIHSPTVSHTIRTAQSIDTMPTSVGSAQSQHVVDTQQIDDSTKPTNEPSPPSEPSLPMPLVTPDNIPPSPPAAGPAQSKLAPHSNPRWWASLFLNIKRSFRV
ncbi:hypothetical protein CPC08DRAFT_713328 [Agrocybe pediades]|nr:hypothetical protein CPC08DRAFT_713328 [Agrocybe pediades]